MPDPLVLIEVGTIYVQKHKDGSVEFSRMKKTDNPQSAVVHYDPPVCAIGEEAILDEVKKWTVNGDGTLTATYKCKKIK